MALPMKKRKTVSIDFPAPGCSRSIRSNEIKLEHETLACHEHSLIERLRAFRSEEHLCDVILRSEDGTDHHAHRNVLSAASAELKTLLAGPFKEVDQINKGQPINITASASVLHAMLEFIYGAQPEITKTDALELLPLSKAYGLDKLAITIQTRLCASMDNQLAFVILQQQIWDFPELRFACEEHVATNFQECMLKEDFLKISGLQLQRILKREDLNVSREEVVLESLFKWAKASKDRSTEMCFLLSHIDFQSFASCTLNHLQHMAQSLGPKGMELECQIQEVLKLRAGASASVRRQPRLARFAYDSDSDAEIVPARPYIHHPKRRCLTEWSAILGAHEKNLRGHMVVGLAKVGEFNRLDWHQTAFVLADERNSRVVSCHPGENDKGFVALLALTNRDLGIPHFKGSLSHAITPQGNLFVAAKRHDPDQWNLLPDQWNLLCFFGGKVDQMYQMDGFFNMCCSPSGQLYVLDLHGSRIQKLEKSTLKPWITASELPKEQAFQANYIFVSKKEVVYLTDGLHRRILSIDGTSDLQVVADFASYQPKKPEILSGLCVTEDEQIFVADRENCQILMKNPGEKTWCSILDTSKFGSYPLDVLVQDGLLNVLVYGNTNGVYQCALPPKLQLDPLCFSSEARNTS